MATELPTSITTFGQALRYCRNKRGLTVRDLAAQVGLSAPFITDLEHDRRSTTRVADFASALDVQVEALLGLDITHVTARAKAWMESTPDASKLLLRILDDARPIGALQKLLGASDEN